MYTFERIDENRLKDLLIILRAVGNNVDLQTLTKKFDTDIFKQKFIGYIAYDFNTMPAAFYGVFPIILKNNEVEIFSAQSGDTATHPDHQGKGLFIKLAKMTYDLALSLKISYIWGFPNENSYHGFIRKLDWVDNGRLKKVKYKLNTIPVSKLIKFFNNKVLSESYFKIMKYFTASNLKEYIDDKIYNDFTIPKNIEFFNYKQYNKNRILFGDENNCFWIKVDGELLIGDFKFQSEASLKKVWKKLKFFCFVLGINEIAFIASSNNFKIDILRNLDKVKIIDSLPFCNLNILDSYLISNKISFCCADFDTF